MPEGVDLEGELRRVDPDRWLATRFIADPTRCADVVALYAFDHELARAQAVTSNALAAEIRLVWWGEVVDEIFAGRPVRRHPVAEALAVAIARGLPRGPFEAMIAARTSALEIQAFPPDEALAWATGAQGSLAVLAALVLGAGEVAGEAAPAGVVWGLILLGRAGRTSGGVARERIIEAASAARKLPTTAFPAAVYATLARAPEASDLEKRARLTWAALSGRL